MAHNNEQSKIHIMIDDDRDAAKFAAAATTTTTTSTLRPCQQRSTQGLHEGHGGFSIPLEKPPLCTWQLSQYLLE